jgi:hypothetical protein
VTGERDYRKFLNDKGRLHTRYLPRSVYTGLVKDYRSEDGVIDEVFDELYFSWDLNQKLEAMERAGETPSKAVAAQQVLNEMDDQDWWRVMAAFERVLARDFIEVAERWADRLDPIYDDQEEHGWRHLQP